MCLKYFRKKNLVVAQSNLIEDFQNLFLYNQINSKNKGFYLPNKTECLNNWKLNTVLCIVYKKGEKRGAMGDYE